MSYREQYHHAIAAAQVHNWERMLEITEQMVFLKPKEWNARTLRAQALCNSDRIQEAAKELESAIRLGAAWDRIERPCRSYLPGTERYAKLKALSDDLESEYKSRLARPMQFEIRRGRQFASFEELERVHKAERAHFVQTRLDWAARPRNTAWWNLLDQQVADLTELGNDAPSRELIAPQVSDLGRRYEAISLEVPIGLSQEAISQTRSDLEALLGWESLELHAADAVSSLGLLPALFADDDRRITDICVSVLKSTEDSCYERICEMEAYRLCRDLQNKRDPAATWDCPVIHERVSRIVERVSVGEDPFSRELEKCTNELSFYELRTARARVASNLLGQEEFVDFDGILLDGRRSRLSEHLGNVNVIEFWASWCSPCIANIKDIEKFAAEYPEGAVTIIGVNLDRAEDGWDTERVAALARQLGVDGTCFAEGEGLGGPISRGAAVTELPTTFIVDSGGRVVETHVGRFDGAFFDTLRATISAAELNILEN